MAAKQEKQVKIIVAFVAVLFLALAGGWVWLWKKAAGVKQEISGAEVQKQANVKKREEIRDKLMEFDRSGQREYYRRMLPNQGDHPLVHDLRFFESIEREAGVQILKGEGDTKKKKASGKNKDPFEEVLLVIEIASDYSGLVRFLEGIEGEVDRDASVDGGRLFEVREIKTLAHDERDKKNRDEKSEEEAVKFVLPPGWKKFSIKFACFELKEKP